MRRPRDVQPRCPSPSDQLAALVRQSGRSPAAIAAAAEVSPSVVCRFLSGARGITSETFDRLASALGGLRLVEVSTRRKRSDPSSTLLPELTHE